MRDRHQPVPGSISTVRRWWLLTVGLIATLCATVFINGIAFLIPVLDAVRGISLAEAGMLSSMPSLGMVVTLIGWGYLTDRVGERLVLTLGLALTAVAALAAALVPAWMYAESQCVCGGSWAAACGIGRVHCMAPVK